MFTYLYNTIFPFLGEFFGKLVAIANVPYYDFVNALRRGTGLIYANLFTGVGGYLNLFQSKFLSTVLNYLTFGVNVEYPLWVVLLFSFLSVYLVVGVVKFFL